MAGEVPRTLDGLAPWLEGRGEFAPALAALARRLAVTVDGAWGSAAALATAALARRTPVTLLVVLAHPRDVDAWAEDLRSFTGLASHVFPAWDALPGPDTVADEVGGQRLRLLRRLDSDAPPRLVLATMPALLQPVPTRAQLAERRRRLTLGQTIPPETLAEWLVDRGFQRMNAVELPGEFSQRGGILDVFSPDAEAPYRIEFFGDDVESIRQFSPETQRSLGDLKVVELTAPGQPIAGEGGMTGHLCDWLPPATWTALVEIAELEEQAKHYLERTPDVSGLFSAKATFAQLVSFPSAQLSAMPATSVETTAHLRVESVERFSGEVAKVQGELDALAPADWILVACRNEGERQRLGEILGAGAAATSGRLHLTLGQVRSGFRVVLDDDGADAVRGIVVVGDHELFRRDVAASPLPRRRLESRAIDSFLELVEDDFVVHLSHGIARYRGMHLLEKNGRNEEHLVLEFAGGTKVHVPASKIDLVQKYVGGAKAEPELSKLGSGSWQKKKDRVETAVLDLASDMIELQALRAARPGIAYPPDTDWQHEFEASFPYEETPDQRTSLGEIKEDMHRARPMDRLLCGDVGYGKTELALRAAFKAIDNGRQVAVLVPTTVLAEQHYRTFSQRMAEYPFAVECLSRFRSAAEQRKILKRLADGSVDVVVGTHRLVSEDVKFSDLGLVVIDEEQRFGVEHKEKLKKLRETVDVLTMTATPIPRTLHLSLLGVRDISNLETPPQGRMAIESRIVRWDNTLIRHAIVRELNREGQVYFVHNRVFSIQDVANRIRSLVPEARIVVGHGQMTPDQLESAMVKFVNREADILVATTIIESGLDIPNANTIFIHHADTYGLADLHQLRGRVGRHKHRAYAYFVLDGDNPLAANASRRLKAIEEFTELGAGFKIAMRDLEIRGAGNILGTQQSGHIAAVGYELYCQLLENAVRSLKNLPAKSQLEVNVDLPWPGLLPRDYVPGQKLRIEVYRRLSRVKSVESLDDFRTELRDRYGALPEPVEWLMRLAEMRILAAEWKIASIHREGKGLEDGASPIDVVLGYRKRKQIETLAARTGGRLRVVDDESAYLRLKPHEWSDEPLYRLLQQVLRLPGESV